MFGIVTNEEHLAKLKSLNEILNNSAEGLSVKLVSGTFLDETFKVLMKNLDDVKTAFNCQRLDYKKNAEESKLIINKWVKRCTEKKIQIFFAIMEPETACVLVSCIYFKGDWFENFNSCDTIDGNFDCAEGQTYTVKMMYQKKKCYSFTSDPERRFQCVKLPYKQRDFSMLIILPNEKFAVDYVVKNLDFKTIQFLKDDKIYQRKYLLFQVSKFKI